jgi:hypothetical protein
MGLLSCAESSLGLSPQEKRGHNENNKMNKKGLLLNFEYILDIKILKITVLFGFQDFTLKPSYPEQTSATLKPNSSKGRQINPCHTGMNVFLRL